MMLKIFLTIAGISYFSLIIDLIQTFWSCMPIKEEEGGSILYIKKDLTNECKYN